MKKQITLILLAAVLASTFACEGRQNDVTDETTAGDTTPEVTTELTDGLPDKNMEDFEFNIHHSTQASMSWVNLELDAEAENGEYLNDAIYKRNQYIEERFKCNLNITEAHWDDNASNFRSIVMAGDNPYDIFFIYGNRVMGNLDSIADFNNIPHINLEKDWWNPARDERLQCRRKADCRRGQLHALLSLERRMLHLQQENSRRARATENMYDLVRNGRLDGRQVLRNREKGHARPRRRKRRVR